MKVSKIIKNFFGHLTTINEHRFLVMKHCFRVGLYKQGLTHDLSKYSPTEFIPGVKYFQGDRSPNNAQREHEGYSSAWLHHKGRNKHHPEYWVDWALPQKAIIMPYKYAVEMVCDKMAAGIVYNGKDWKQDTQIKYYMKERETSIVHPQIDKFLLEIFTQVSEQGIDKTLTKKNIREVYDKYCVRMEKLDENKV